MKCDKCPKEATIHLTEIINSKMYEMHLCEECANDPNLAKFGNYMEDDEGFEAPLNDMLMGLGSEEVVERCPGCGSTWTDFEKKGRLGCPECYSAFSKTLMPLIKRVQRSTKHAGKKCEVTEKTSKANSDLQALQARLRQSIKDEAFEEAAKLRDQIKKVEDILKKKKSK